MSRGPGSIQRMILDQLADGRERLGREVCWTMARQLNRVVTRSGDRFIDSNFYKSFHRAVSSLALSLSINSYKRMFGRFREIVAYYPFHTSSENVLILRQKFLPLAEAYLRSRTRLKYDPEQNERYIVLERQRSAVSERRGKVTRKRLADENADWQSIEDRLIASMQGPHRDLILTTIVRGRQLFCGQLGIPTYALVRNAESLRHQTLECHEALGSILLRWQKVKDVEASLALTIAELSLLYERALPALERSHVRLRTALYELLDGGSSTGPARVKDEFKRFLVSNDPVSMEPFARTEDHFGFVTYRFDARLDAIVQRDVFARFEFIRL